MDEGLSYAENGSGARIRHGAMEACPICESRQVAETLAAKELCKGTREVFDYAVCAGCGSAYILHFPEDIGAYYEGYYSLDNKIPTIEQSRLKQVLVAIYAQCVVRTGLSALVREAFRCPAPWQMDYLSPNLQAFLFLGAKARARILDVGSGWGELVKMMHRFGYDRALGVDPFLQSSSRYAQRGDVFSVEGTYDIILFNHSLEHMTDLRGALKRSTELLAPGGTLVVHIPNLGSREFATYRQHWCWLHAPYHFAIPSRRGMDVLGASVGLSVVDTICTSRADHYLYSDEYQRDIGDRDPQSLRRELEAGTFDARRYRSLARTASTLNRNLQGDWVAYYLRLQ